MAIFRYLTHPQVVIDPKVEVTQWGLTQVGHARVNALATSDVLRGTGFIASSDEVKAKETAAPIAKALNVGCQIIPRSHENDRSATGYLAAQAFEHAADEFFAHPLQSFKGWERAADAQKRILGVFHELTNKPIDSDMLMVGHGAVGTLLYCALTQTPISRDYDQKQGGSLWSYDLSTKKMHHHWRSIEDVIANYDGA